jgi:hypothetical protein
MANIVNAKSLLRIRRTDEKMPPAGNCNGRLAFADLVVQLAALAPGLDSASLMEGGPFSYGRSIACLTYEPDVAPNCAILHIDVGSLSSSDPASAALALLEDNHESCMQRRGFSITPVTGHVVFSVALPLENLGTDALLDALEQNAQRAARLVGSD